MFVLILTASVVRLVATFGWLFPGVYLSFLFHNVFLCTVLHIKHWCIKFILGFSFFLFVCLMVVHAVIHDASFNIIYLGSSLPLSTCPFKFFPRRSDHLSRLWCLLSFPLCMKMLTPELNLILEKRMNLHWYKWGSNTLLLLLPPKNQPFW